MGVINKCLIPNQKDKDVVKDATIFLCLIQDQKDRKDTVLKESANAIDKTKTGTIGIKETRIVWNTAKYSPVSGLKSIPYTAV